MPAPVRSACARPALRRLADPRPASPALARRQTRHFRVWWSSPWDPDHARRHRALWQRYAKLRGDVWGPQWGPPHSFPPLMREMQKFEKWVRDLETQDPPKGDRRPRCTQEWSEPWAAYAPSRRCEGDHARFYGGRDGPSGQKRDGDSSAPKPRPNKDKPVERHGENKARLRQEWAWTASSPGQKDHVIDPVTNKRVPRPEQNASSDGPGRKGADPTEPSPSSTIHLGPGDVEAAKGVDKEGLTKNQPSSPASPKQPQRETTVGKTQSSPPEKNGKKNVKAVDTKPQSQVTAKTSSNGGDKDGLPSKSNEPPADTRLQKKKTRMTGNYVRDFPEDFTETWSGSYRSETSVDKKSSTERLEPALNRTGAASVKSKPKEETEPAERKTTHSELVEEIKEILTDTAALGGMPAHPDPESRSEPRGTEEFTATVGNPHNDPDMPPNLYKVLVYDDRSQTVISTDATSVTPDETDEILTPAEALSRLADPSKFLSHLKPLEAQGYEVFSGGEQLLVFRKRRAATEPGTVFLRGTRHASLPEPGGDGSAPAVNPIDMMGREPVVPSIGNFASPTGYVDYGEGVREGAGRKPPPPFRDASEVEYEEAKGGKRRGALWRASVGAAWVAGLVYGGSVVGEYFSTGGESGEGSRGEF